MNQFYQQIVQVKQWIVNDQLTLEAKAILKLQHMPSDEEIATAVSLKLTQWLGQMRLHWKSKLTDKQCLILDKGCFAMVALADELFIIELEWLGKSHWHQVLLEEYFYESCSAGGIFYREIDKLLASGKHEPLDVQLSSVYLLVLRLGFAGRYSDDITKIKEYRHKLFKIIAQHQTVAKKVIHSQAYEHCLESKIEQRLAPISKWYRGAVYSVIIYLLVGGLSWYLLNQGLEKWLPI